MKRIIIVLIIIVFCLVARSYARDFYLSIAPTISLENFDLQGIHEIINTVIPMLRAEVGPDHYKNYFSTGIGYMAVDIGDSLYDAIWKIGIGFDYLNNKSIALEGQINYVVGLGKVKFIEYYNAALGLKYLF